MPNVHRPRARTTATLLISCSLAILVSAFLMIASTARAAETGGYGELTRFGASSGFEGHLAPTYTRTRLIGVDPAESNSVFLLEEPKEPTPKKRFLRLAKYSANGSGEYSLSTSSEFSITAAEVVNTEPEIEGLAVEPSEEKLYMLAADAREAKLKHASRTPSGQGVLAASTLYAFSTKTLAAASGTKAGGIVIGEAELAANSETAGAALLQPSGITVDPNTHEVIVAGHEDDSTEPIDNTRSASDHYVLQRITATGTLGARYVDKGNVLKEEASVGERFPTPDSPTVATVAGKERVYIGFNNGLAEIPYDFSSTSAPNVSPGPPAGIDGGISTLPGTTGGVVSSFEGTIFGANASGITNQEPGGEGRAGVTAYSAETASPIGWTGGAQLRASEPKQKCVISPYNFSLLPNVAAGSEGKVFVLAPEFVLREEEGEPEIEEIEVESPKGSGEFETEIIEKPTFVPLAGPFFAPVIEFGPGGSGCPQASATAPVATVNGIEVKGEEAVKTGSEVIFSSQLKQADALKVEWNFGDGTSETVTGDEYQSTSVKHKFSKEGSFTVTEKIYSDDLAAVGQTLFSGGQLSTPTIAVTKTLFVGAHPPKAQFVAPSAASIGEAIAFVNHSSDPNGAEGLPLEYAWSFGDGASASSASPSHSYAAAGNYTVTLTVTDHLGLKASVSQPLTVTASSSPPPSGGGGGGGGSSGGGGGSSSSGGSAGGGSTTGTTGNTGVLSYAVSIAGSSLSVSKSGSFVLKVDCGGQSSCTGTAVLRTASAVSAGVGKRKKAVVTLASGSFAVAGGQLKALGLHLTSSGRLLLKRLHTLKAKVTIVARDSAGVSHSTTMLVTLRAPKTH